MTDSWQPIETAPRDGTDILLGRERDTFVVLAGWDDDPEHAGYPWTAPEALRYPTTAFTHWAPVPKWRILPPSAAPAPPDLPDHIPAFGIMPGDPDRLPEQWTKRWAAPAPVSPDAEALVADTIVDEMIAELGLENVISHDRWRRRIAASVRMFTAAAIAAAVQPLWRILYQIADIEGEEGINDHMFARRVLDLVNDAIRARSAHRRRSDMIPLDKDGWPVEQIIGKPITNWIRNRLHARSWITEAEWQRREAVRNAPDPNVGAQMSRSAPADERE